MKLKFIFVFLFAAIFGYSSYWFYLSLNAGVFLEQAAEDLGNQGITFEYADYSVSGFPYRLEVTLEKVSILFENGPLSTQLVAERMEGIIHPWNFSHIILLPENSVTTFALGLNKQVTLKPEKTSISFISLKDEGYRLSTAMEKVGVSSNLDFPVPAYLETFSAHIRKEPGKKAVTSSLLEPRVLGMAFDGTFPDATRFIVVTSFRGEEVPKLTRQNLTAWRDRGGTFQIDSFNYQADKNSISGSGSFTLDENLKPLGSLGLEGVSNMALLNFFEKTGMLGPGEVSSLRTFLGTIPNQDGKSMPLSLSIQGGFLTLGPARLAEVGSIIQE
jgi:Uncharacterized protein conserved in bacteria (DUF2125)